MKLNSLALSGALKSVGVTKSDIIFSVKDKMGVFSSTDVAAGIRVQSRLQVDSDEEKEYYLSSGVKDAVAALAPYGENITLKESAGSLKLSVGSAKTSVGLLDKEPSSIKVADCKTAYQFSGEEFLFAVNGAANSGDVINFVATPKRIGVYGYSGAKLTKTEISVVKSVNEDTDDISSGCVNVVKEEDDEYIVSFAISSEVWKRVSSECRKDFCVMNVSSSQIRLTWRDVAIVLPLSEKLIPNMESTFNKMHIPADTDMTINLESTDEFVRALNIVLLNSDGKITVETDKKGVVVSSLSGQVVIKVDTDLVDYKAVYDGKKLKEILQLIKNAAKIEVVFIPTEEIKKIFVIYVRNEFVYSDGKGKELTQDVNSVFMLAPIGDSK